MEKKIKEAHTEFHVVGIAPGTEIRLNPLKNGADLQSCTHSISGDYGTPDDGLHKTQNEITLRLGNADGARTTAQEQHRATPETLILGPTHRAPKMEVIRLTNKILVHANTAIVHKSVVRW